MPVRRPHRAERAAALALAVATLGAGRAEAGGNGAFACDFERCLERAFAASPRLAAGQARVESAQAALRIQQDGRAPELGLNGSGGGFSGNSVAPYSLLNDRYDEDLNPKESVAGPWYQLSAELQVPLLREGTLIGRATASERAARLGISAAGLSVMALRREIATAVAEHWFAAASRTAELAPRERVVELLAQEVEEARLRLEQKLVPPSTLLAAEAALARGRRDFTLARLGLEQAIRSLAIELGLEAHERVEIELAATETAALRGAPEPDMERPSSPELEAGRLRIEQREAEIAAIESERSPTLTLTGRGTVADDFAPPLEDQWLAMLELHLPVFDSGLSQARVAEKRAQQSVEQSELRVRAGEARQALIDLAHDAARLEAEGEALASELRAARAALEEKRSLRQLLLVASDEVRAAEQVLLRLELAIATNRFERARVAALLRVAAGEFDGRTSATAAATAAPPAGTRLEASRGPEPRAPGNGRSRRPGTGPSPDPDLP